MAIGTSGVSVPSMGQTIDSSIYGNKEAPKGMSLSDIVELSRSSTALQKEKALLEPQIRAGKAAAETAETSAAKAKLGLSTDFADKMRQNQIALINHPLIVRRVVRQMRKTKKFNCYAYGYDELGNRIALGLNGIIFN